jgi:hypothetical protein
MPRDGSTIAEVTGKVRASVKTQPFLLLPALLVLVLLAVACGSSENVPLAPGEALASPPDSFIKAPRKGGSTTMQAPPPAPAPAPAPPPVVDAGPAPKDAGAGPKDAGKAPVADAGKSAAPRDAGAAKK